MSLSERLTPNVECSPWVIAEVKILEQQVLERDALIEQLRGQFEPIALRMENLVLVTESQAESICFRDYLYIKKGE